MAPKTPIKTSSRPAKRRDSNAGASGGAEAAGAIRFTATLHQPAAPANASWSFLNLPAHASAKLPSRSMNSVEGTLNGSPFRATLEPDGMGGHWLKVARTLREASGARVGQTITLQISPVAREPEPKVPADLRKALAAANPKARAAWADITPMARRDWIFWMTSGKKAQTRALRIDKACDMLAKGKRRPCCFDRSGMYDKSLSCPIAAVSPSPSSPAPAK